MTILILSNYFPFILDVLKYRIYFLIKNLQLIVVRL